MCVCLCVTSLKSNRARQSSLDGRDTGRIFQDEDGKSVSRFLCGHHGPPPHLLLPSPCSSYLPLSSRGALPFQLGLAWPVQRWFFAPGTLSRLSAALHLHNRICVPFICQVNLLMSGRSINNVLLGFYFLGGGGVWKGGAEDV